jgi:hypothetical protein
MLMVFHAADVYCTQALSEVWRIAPTKDREELVMPQKD